ncbi:MAG: hypothetical protein WAQ57_00955 [Candidatus Saccharimonadales bacterium]
MKKREAEMLARWEVELPRLIEFTANDLRFLQTVEALVSGQDDWVIRLMLLTRAAMYDQRLSDIKLTKERFAEDLAEAQEFITGPHYSVYYERFSRYV